MAVGASCVDRARGRGNSFFSLFYIRLLAEPQTVLLICLFVVYISGNVSSTAAHFRVDADGA